MDEPAHGERLAHRRHAFYPQVRGPLSVFSNQEPGSLPGSRPRRHLGQDVGAFGNHGDGGLRAVLLQRVVERLFDGRGVWTKSRLRVSGGRPSLTTLT